MKSIICLLMLVLILSGCGLILTPTTQRERMQKSGTNIITRCEDKIVCVYDYNSRDINHCFRDEDLVRKYCKEEKVE